AAFDRSLQSAATLTAPIELDHIGAGQSSLAEMLNTSPFLTDLRGSGRADRNGQAPTSRKRDEVSWWLNVPANELPSRVDVSVRARIAAIVEASDVSVIQDDMTFSELGFDSLTAVELRNHITETFGLRLSPTVIFDYPTVSSLIDYVLALVRDLQESQNDSTGKMSRFITDIKQLIDSDMSQLDSRAEFADSLEGIVKRLRADFHPNPAEQTLDSDEMDDEQLLEYLGNRFGEGEDGK
ncbi:phosphopantetheine-binding protein, partial [Streptomyces sp. NPDC127133]